MAGLAKYETGRTPNLTPSFFFFFRLNISSPFHFSSHKICMCFYYAHCSQTQLSACRISSGAWAGRHGICFHLLKEILGHLGLSQHCPLWKSLLVHTDDWMDGKGGREKERKERKKKGKQKERKRKGRKKEKRNRPRHFQATIFKKHAFHRRMQNTACGSANSDKLFGGQFGVIIKILTIYRL